MTAAYDNTSKKITEKVKTRPMSVAKLASELKMRREFVAGYLEAMKDFGKLEMIRVGKAKVYKPKN